VAGDGHIVDDRMVDHDRSRQPTTRSMSWWESVRTAGWTGKPLGNKPVAVSVEVLRRGIKGQRRRIAAQRRVDDWRAELASKDRLTLAELADLLTLSEPGDGGGDSTLVFIDIEIDSSEQIRQVGVAVRFEDRIVLAKGTAADLEWLPGVLRGRAVVAHNGAEHDFPRLAAAGVELPPMQLDSLRWSWLAWPTLTSHALGALLEHIGTTVVAPELLHDAVADAHGLALVWAELVDEISAIDAPARTSLRYALGEVETQAALDLVIGPCGEVVAPMPQPIWQPDPGAPAAPHRVLSRSRRLPARDGAVAVVASIARAWMADPAAGLILRPSLVLDPAKVEVLADGWKKAIAMRVLACARGALPLVAPSARRLLDGLGREGFDVLCSPGAPLITDLAAVSLLPVRRPLSIDVGLAALFESVNTGVVVSDPVFGKDAATFTAIGDLAVKQRKRLADLLKEAVPDELRSLADAAVTPGALLHRDDGSYTWMVDAIDIGRHVHGVDLVLDGPVGAGRSRALWKQLLGEDVEIEGDPAQRVDWSTIDGLVRPSAQHAGHRTAQLLGIAAAREANGESTLVVDAPAHRDVAEPVAAQIWRQRVGAFLLRPPVWPTIDESRRRLGSGTSRTALVGDAAARTLADLAGAMLVAKAPVPSLRNRTMQRLVAGDFDDPYTSIVEPLAAHLAAELICSGQDGRVSIADPLLSSGLLADLCGAPSSRHVSQYPCDDKLTSDILEKLTSAAVRRRTTARAVAAATRRLLPPGAELKPFQDVVIKDVVAGKDVIAVFRTGFGKSLCYQVPGLAFAAVDGVTIVISPLIALQRDQLRGLREKGVTEAAVYNSSLTPQVRDGVLRGTRAGFYRLLFVSPEALSGHALRRTLQEVDVALIAIDEAHCISEMGHEFRPDYRVLPRSIARLSGLPDDSPRSTHESRPTIVALTGTASPHVIDDIKVLLS
jgi:hypothetical protein